MLIVIVKYNFRLSVKKKTEGIKRKKYVQFGSICGENDKLSYYRYILKVKKYTIK